MANMVNAALAGHMVEEAAVNGVWVGILQAHFPFPAYIICPEARNKDNSRVDLMVRRAATLKPVLVLEGKAHITAADVDREFASNAQQIIGYLKQIIPRSSLAYGVVAAGTKFAITKWDGSTLTRVKGDLTHKNGTLFPGDITVAADVLEIDAALAAIAVWTTANYR